MSQLIRTVAKIHLFEGSNMRKVPFRSGYRPLFEFEGANTRISGKIVLTQEHEFQPGHSGVVEIMFNKGIINDRHFKIGTTFYFGEGPSALGKGEFLEVEV